MAKGSVYEGKSFDEAVRKGLEDLGLARAEAAITLVEEGKGGFLGFGARAFKVSIMRRPGGALREPEETRERRVVGKREERRGGRGGRDRDSREGKEGRDGKDRKRDDHRRGGQQQPAAKADALVRGGERREERGGEGREERGTEKRDERRGSPRGGPRPQPAGATGPTPAVASPTPMPAAQPARPRDDDEIGPDGQRRRRRRGRRGGRGRRREPAEAATETGFAQAEVSARMPVPEAVSNRNREDDADGGRVEQAPRVEREGSAQVAVMNLPVAEPRAPEHPILETSPATDDAPPAHDFRDDGGPEMNSQELAETSTRLTEELLRAMGFEATVTVATEGNRVDVTVEVARDEDLLNGQKGETRQALQHLLNRFLNRGEGSRYHLLLEITDFWARREKELEDLARSLAEQALSTNSEQATEFLNSQERRIVHVTLKEDARVKTYAPGTGMIKRVTIAPADFPERTGEEVAG